MAVQGGTQVDACSVGSRYKRRGSGLSGGWAVCSNTDQSQIARRFWVRSAGPLAYMGRRWSRPVLLRSALVREVVVQNFRCDEN